MIRTIALVLFATVASFAQRRPEFEVASVRAVSADQPQALLNAGLHIDGAQVRISYLSLKDYIGLAYQLRPNQITGPDWLASERFDVTAKLPEGAAQSDVPKMLQALLGERFHLKAHRETKEFSVYALQVAKTGFRIPESTVPAGGDETAVSIAAAGSPEGAGIQLGKGQSFTLSATGFQSKGLTMGVLADMLTRFLDRPVIDRTRLKGHYDLRLDVTPEDRMMMLVRSAVSAGVFLPPQALALMDHGSIASLADSLNKTGLTLDPQKAALPVLIVDEMEKTPTEN